MRHHFLCPFLSGDRRQTSKPLGKQCLPPFSVCRLIALQIPGSRSLRRLPCAPLRGCSRTPLSASGFRLRRGYGGQAGLIKFSIFLEKEGKILRFANFGDTGILREKSRERRAPDSPTEKNAPHSSPNPNFPCPQFESEYIRPIPAPISKMPVHLLPTK